MRDTTLINGSVVDGTAALDPGDRITIGGVDFTFHPITAKELGVQERRRSDASLRTPWESFILLTVFQILTVIEFAVTRHDSITTITGCFAIYTAVMWL